MKCWTVKLDLNFSFEYFFLETLSFSVLCTEFSFRCSILSVLKTLLLFLFLARHQLVNPPKSMLYLALLILGMVIAPSTTTTTAPLLSCFMNRIIWHPRVCHEFCLCFALLLRDTNENERFLYYYMKSDIHCGGNNWSWGNS